LTRTRKYWIISAALLLTELAAAAGWLPAERLLWGG
jgi:hypothetical protein